MSNPPEEKLFFESKSLWFGQHGVVVRALRTFAQTAVAMIGVGTFSDWSTRWSEIVLTAGTAALLSLLMSLDAPTYANGSTELTVTSDVPIHPDIPAAPPRYEYPTADGVPQVQPYEDIPPAVGCGNDLRG